MPFFNTPLSSLNYSCFGKGQPVVLLHGFLEDHRIWDTVVSELENHQIVRVDLPGHGKSTLHTSKISIAEMAQIISDLLRFLKIENPVIIGHSMGGYVGLELIQLIPSKLCLLHSNFWEDPASKKNDRNRVIEILRNNAEKLIREAIPGLFYTPNIARCSTDIIQLTNNALEMDPKGLMAATAAMRDRKDHSETLVTHEIVIIHGDKDPIITSEQLNLHLESAVVKPEIYTLEQTGHMSIWENPEGLIKCLKSILNQ